MNWFQRMNRRVMHAFVGPPDINVGPEGQIGLLERGPQYSDWLAEQLMGKQNFAVPAAGRAHDVLVGSLLACDMGVVQETDNPMVVEELPDHPVNRLLRAPSRIVSGRELWKDYFSRYLQGNAHLFVRRTSDFLPIELVPVTCSKSQATGNPLNSRGVLVEHWLKPIYGDRFPDRETWPDRHVIRNHWPNSFQPKSLKSLPPISGYAASVIKNNTLLQKHYARRLSRPLPSSSAVTLDKALIEKFPELSFKDYFELCSQFGDLLSQWMQQDKVLTLPPGVGVASGINDLDLKAIELLDLTVDEIARIYGAPPAFLFRYHVQSYRALEQENVAFARRTILLHVELIGDELTRKLLLPQEQMRGQRIRLNLTPLELGTLTERIAAATMATADSGLWKDNEGRELTGKGPVADGDKRCEPRGGPTTRTPQQGVQPKQQADPLQFDPLITPQNGSEHDYALHRP